MDLFNLLTAVILVVLVAIIFIVGIGLYVSSRRERAEQQSQTSAAAPVVAPVVTPVGAGAGDFFSGVENSNNVILDASKERPRRGTGYGATTEQEDFDL